MSRAGDTSLPLKSVRSVGTGPRHRASTVLAYPGPVEHNPEA
jgi:hypothetical protein